MIAEPIAIKIILFAGLFIFLFGMPSLYDGDGDDDDYDDFA